MQKLRFALIFSLFAYILMAQGVAPRYVLAEHFTNTKCPICKSKNPAFYTLLDQHPSEVHHIAYHPSVPYNTCVFYLANTTENNARTSFYGVDGTPRVALNGTLVAQSGTLLPAATLNAQLGGTSPIWVEVVESGSLVSVAIHTLSAAPAGTYKLYVAFAEKTVNYNAPNGETVHHDVFRDMLSPIDGDAVTLPPVGTSVVYTYPKTSNTAWNTSEMFATAWVQNTATKEVLNSGTRFDPVVTGVDEAQPASIALLPNPATEVVDAILPNDQPQSAEVFALNGALVQTTATMDANRAQIDIANLLPGIYFVRIRGEKGTFTGKFVKQ